MFPLDFSGLDLLLRHEDGRAFVFDPIRKKWLVLTPEEQVRQYLLQYFIIKQKYPRTLIAVEKTIKIGTLSKRFDIVVYNKSHLPWLLVECKAPDVTITKKTLYQLLNYQNIMQCNHWMLTNGHEHYCADARDRDNIVWLSSLPIYDDV